MTEARNDDSVRQMGARHQEVRVLSHCKQTGNPSKAQRTYAAACAYISKRGVDTDSRTDPSELPEAHEWNQSCCPSMSIRNLVTKRRTWIMQPAGIEERLVVLMGDEHGEYRLHTIYVLPPIANRCTLRISLDSKLLSRGIGLSDLSSFCRAVRSISRQRKAKISRSRSRLL